MTSIDLKVSLDDWRSLIERISKTTAQVASLEGELDFSRLQLQMHKLSLVLSSGMILASVAIFWSNALLGIILGALGFLVTFIGFLMESRDEKKHREIYVRYATARTELEFLKANLSVGASLGQWQA